MKKIFFQHRESPKPIPVCPDKLALTLAALVSLCLAARAAETNHVSFYNDVYPLFKRSCTGCHHPGKLKGQLDLTAYPAFLKGGKHGAAFAPNDPAKSRI